jgi:hypothetical protein
MDEILTKLQQANPHLEIMAVTEPEFEDYGRLLPQFDPEEMIERARAILPDAEGVVYEASVEALEKPSAFNRAIAREVYGGMPVQAGWCYGKNLQMGALEYHKGTEVVVCLTDTILLVGLLPDVIFGNEIVYYAENVEAFYAPEGAVVEFYPWNLHFAPIHVQEGGDFATLVYLPRGTNEPLPYAVPRRTGESRLLFAINKWLIAHADSKGLVEDGAYVGIIGDNIVINPVSD